MKKALLVTLLMISFVLMVFMVACNSSKGRPDFGGFAAIVIESNEHNKVYYVEAADLAGDLGNNSRPLDNAKTAWNAAKPTLEDYPDAKKNFYMTLSALEPYGSDDLYIYVLGAGTEFEKGNYAKLYDLAVNTTGAVLFMSDDSDGWIPWDAERARRDPLNEPARGDNVHTDGGANMDDAGTDNSTITND
ncbi:MAG: hypothetical protein LBB49_05115 [Gracilibacteraceae bacterium]|jgi:hypothetical protein|nr:hypothetical protein [Gracilibacteraceae bacterium]